MRLLVLVGAALLSGACASLTPGQRLDALAAQAGAARSVVQGREFKHVVYSRGTRGRELSVFIEGDGLPMVRDRVVKDPTTRDPIALRLMLQSSDSAVYVGRPCYHALDDARCTWRDWTLGRYSTAVVDSMAEVVRQQARALSADRVKLIGHSGGGVLAVLIAERLDDVSAVITLAANLDVDAWAAHHSYTPLSDSLNPARSERAHPWHEVHLQGVRDRIVPRETTRAYFEKFANADRVMLEHYDHECCWVRDWPTLSEQAVAVTPLAR